MNKKCQQFRGVRSPCHKVHAPAWGSKLRREVQSTSSVTELKNAAIHSRRALPPSCISQTRFRKSIFDGKVFG